MEEEAAVALLGVTFFLVMGGVILLRPIAQRAGELLRVVIHEKRMRIEAQQQAGDLVCDSERLEDRLRRVEDRLDFAEGLLSSPSRGQLESRAAGHAEDAAR